jgi:cytochrome P450
MDLARRNAPVFYAPRHDLWFVTKYADVLEVLREPILYSSLRAHDTRVPMPDEISAQVGDDYYFPMDGQLSATDPPQHTRLRKLVQPAFKPSLVNRYKPRLRAIADELVDTFDKRGEVDFVSAFARRLPALFIATVIGSPVDEADQFHRWVPHFFALTGNSELDPAQSLESWSNVLAWQKYAEAFVEMRRRCPSDDLTSDLINARSDDGSPALTDQEITVNTLGFIGAGSDNSATLMTQVLHLLLTHPDQWQLVVEDPEQWLPAAIEESMRYRPPALTSKRTASSDAELGGVAIPAGSNLMLHLGSANRDPSVFPEPNKFDITRRSDSKNLGWGLWTHFCVGAPLAKLEVQVALETVIDRLVGVRLADPSATLDYHGNFVQPAIGGLAIRWDVGTKAVGPLTRAE